MGQIRMSLLRYALFTVPAVVLLGLLSGQVAGSGYGNPWFDALVKPSFMPPGWLFGVAWTILYTLLGLSLAMVLHARGARHRGRAITLFVLGLVLNFAWSPVFFALHEMAIALSILGAMVVLTVALIGLMWPIRPLAALLLVPYLAWLIFATALNYTILDLNPNAAELVPGGASTDIRL